MTRNSSPWSSTFVRSLLAWSCALVLCASAVADVFTLADGRKLEGKVKRETPSSYFIETAIGELEIKKSDVVTRVVGKTVRETFDELFNAAKSAQDYFEAGEYANSARSKTLATKAWKKALEVDAQHAGANKALGNVLYRDKWMTPEERDKRAAEDEAAEMLEKGFVRWKDGWVTPEEKLKLEQGLILRDGKWMSVAESKRLDGLEEFEGQWYPRAEALSRGDIAAVAKLLARPLRVTCNEQVAVAGDWPEAVLTRIATDLASSRLWFDASFKARAGVDWLGGRLPQFYVWSRDSTPYQSTVAHFASLTQSVPEGWAPVVKDRHGFFWIDPYAVSSARVWNRPDDDLIGHCVHHWGHMMVGRLGYDGRLLPPWYDEGLASLAEFKQFGRNAVFCRSAATIAAVDGTAAKKGAATFNFDVGLFREGAWKATLQKALAANAVPKFDRLASLEIAQLELLDIACGMAITWWLEEHSPDALSKFHAEMHKLQPLAPLRVLAQARDRQAQYDVAFQAAVGMNWRDADQTWRTWFIAR